MGERDNYDAVAAELQRERAELRQVAAELRAMQQQQENHSCTEKQLPELKQLKLQLQSARAHIIKLKAQGIAESS